MREEIERSEVGDEGHHKLYPLKFRIILTLRYFHVQILLHRPILVKFLDATGPSGLEAGEAKLLNDIGYSSMNKCIDSAMGIIDIIHELVSTTGWQKDLLGAWWYSLYYSTSPTLYLIDCRVLFFSFWLLALHSLPSTNTEPQHSMPPWLSLGPCGSNVTGTRLRIQSTMEGTTTTWIST